VSETATFISIEERKALNWYRVQGPAETSVPGSPQRRMRVTLVRRGLLHIHPDRRKGDPIQYAITERGREALHGS
jgi:hypothetical protein